MLKKLTSGLFLLFMIAISVTAQSYQPIADRVEIESNLTFLASDEVEGREAGTRGEKIASDYIALMLERYGVKPFGDQGTYFQNFYMMNVFSDGSHEVVFSGNDGKKSQTLSWRSDYVRNNLNWKSGQYSGEIVFAGYGIEAKEEYQYSNYEGVDVKGKFALVYAGQPTSQRSNYFKGNNYASLNHKIEAASKKGASGLIVIYRDTRNSNWERVINFYDRRQLRMKYSIEDEISLPVIFISEGAAKTLLAELSPFKYERLTAQMDSIGFKSSALPMKTSMKLKPLQTEKKLFRNVIGIVEGSDPVLKNEYVAISAHYDHEGIKPNGDIYNGADDDGSGTVTVMEVGRLIAKSKELKRSSLFIFHTAEEKGLLGAAYLVDNFPQLKQVSGLINMDMVGRESVDTIYSVGSGKLSSELKKMVEDVNSKTVKFVFDYKFDDPNDPQRIYFRSDHYHYAKNGVPIVFFYDYMLKDYHRATDTVEKINFPKIVKMSNLGYYLMKEIGNHPTKLVVDQVTQ